MGSRPTPDIETLMTVSHPRRLAILAVLGGVTGPIGIDRLSVLVAEHETSDGVVSSDLVEAVRTTLYHVHLPKLHDVGLIAFDPTQGTVDERPPAETFRTVTREIRQTNDDWDSDSYGVS